MDELLKDPLVIGITGSLVAALVAFVSKQALNLIMRKKQIAEANRLIISQLRAYIVNKDIPPEHIFTAMQRSAARKYRVKPEKLLSFSECIEEISAEVIGNTYLQFETQTEFLNRFDNFLRSKEIKEGIKRETKEKLLHYVKFSEGPNSILPQIASILAAIVTVIIMMLSK